MPISWEKVMPHRPHMLETARSWYDKWIRGERARATDGKDSPSTSQFDEGGDQVEAYAEPVKIEDVVEVKEATKDVASRLDALEFAGMAQAETLKNLTDQNQALTRSLSDLQHELDAVDQHLQEARADAEGHRVSMEGLEGRMQALSGDLSRMQAQVKMAVWVAVVAVAGAIVAISAVFVR